MTVYLKDKVSPVYKNVLDSAFLDMEIPKEEFATCLDCHHCANLNHPSALTKCCAYHPILPNYMIGAILSDTSDMNKEGRARIISKIKYQIGVTPYGIMAPFIHDLRFNEFIKGDLNLRQKDAEDLLCPYYDNGLCTIWKYRGENCAAFHCSSNGGAEGKLFWQKLYDYLKYIETSMSIYILTILDYPIDKIKINRINPKEINLDNEIGEVDQQVYNEIWDKWKGKEIDFYKSCFSIFQSIQPNKYKSIIGLQGNIIEQQLFSLNQNFKQNIIPELLIFDKDFESIEHLENDLVKIGETTIHALLFGFLKLFDGKTNTHDVVRKSMIMKKSIANIIMPMIETGILKSI